jgi:DNA processing protein
VDSGINLFHLSAHSRLELIKNSRIKLNSLIRELIEPDVNYLRRLAIQEINILKSHQLAFCSYESSLYPERLKRTTTPPLFIHWKGDLLKAVKSRSNIAIVGSRVTDPKYARAIALQAGQFCAESGIWNHSGLALGCDTSGHCGGISSYKHGLCDSAFTGAILGNGLGNSTYPPENAILADEIVKCGGYLLSETPPSMIVKKTWLVLRDRLQSALSDALLIVQTSLNSGTLHTVRYAICQDRTIFVWKGTGLKIPYEYMEGNIQLLNKAVLPTKYQINTTMLKRAHIIGFEQPKEIISKLLPAIQDNQ